MDDDDDDEGGGFAHLLPPPPPEEDDDAEGNFSYLQPQPLAECAVPTVQVTTAHLDRFQPFEWDDSMEARLRLDLVRQLLQRGPFSFVDLENRSFDGEGIYAIYYHGDLPIYLPVRSPGATCPIYLGKRGSQTEQVGGISLHKRLLEHRSSLLQVGLDPDTSFTFRFLCLPPAWIEFAETSLIHEVFRPPWNLGLRGFGNHTTGKNRNQITSPWDTYHPGRRGVGAKNTRTIAEVEEDLRRAIGACTNAYRDVMSALGIPNGVSIGHGSSTYQASNMDRP